MAFDFSVLNSQNCYIDLIRNSKDYSLADIENIYLILKGNGSIHKINP